MSATTTTATNLLALKRPYAVDLSSSLSNNTFVTTTGALESPQKTLYLNNIATTTTTKTRPDKHPSRGRKFHLHTKSNTWPYDRRMPAQMSTQSFADTFTTLSPIYDHDLPSATHQTNEPSPSSTSNTRARLVVSNQSSHSNQTAASSATTQHVYFFHRDSFSTSTSGSSCSSPTTTASLADLVSQETPATSPDTPASTQSLSYPSLSLALRAAPPDGKPDFARLSSLAPPPSKKPRNLKNLAVNTSNTLSIGRAANTAALPVDMASRISPSFPSPQRSATFVKPMQPPPRRKGSALGLTIKTPSTTAPPSQLLSPTLRQLDHPIPPTPSLIRPTALRSFQSSPSLPLLTSKFPPEHGMRLPSISNNGSDNGNNYILSRAITDAPAERDEDEESQNFDIPQSREEKPDAYPDGPICIYDTGVYLYFEPTAEQAAEFDVIFNVASEVKNPFLAADSHDTRVSRSLEQVTASDKLDSTSPSSAQRLSEPEDAGQPANGPKTEYIHIPWEHNTDIVPDLRKLVKVVDQRVKSGKKVLIHCQCGVSRSASLVVAYGLYKRPMITVQEAYDAVKKRSKWIGPNMNLIMQLQEFRSGLVRGAVGGNLGARAGQAPTHSNTASDSGIPRTAPLLPGTGKTTPRAINTEGLKNVAPGPSSAPSGLQWPSTNPSAESSVPSTAAVAKDHSKALLSSESSYVDATGNVISPLAVALSEPSPMKASSKELLTLSLTSPSPSYLNGHIRAVRLSPPPPLTFAAAMSIPTPIESPRSNDFGMTSFTHLGADETFGITSPRNINFTSSPTAQSPTDIEQIVASPRSTEFGMAPFNPPEADDTVTLGLTSPRATTGFGGTSIFETTLDSVGAAHPPPPTHPPPPIPTAAAAPNKFTAILPSQESLQSSHQTQARAELRSKLGLSSKTSHTNMRSAFASFFRSDKKQDAQKPPYQKPSPPPVLPLQSIPDDCTPASFTSTNPNVQLEPSNSTAPRAHAQSKPTAISVSLHQGASFAPSVDNFADALMSPRATEFTSNPFRPALSSSSMSPNQIETEQHSSNMAVIQNGTTSLDGGDTTPKALDQDPRSPPQKGQSPIVRSIFDAFLT